MCWERELPFHHTLYQLLYHLYHHILYHPIGASLVPQVVKNLPAMQETQVSLWVERIPWRREWQPTPAFLPRKSHGQRSMAGYSLWDHNKWDMIEWLTLWLLTAQRQAKNLILSLRAGAISQKCCSLLWLPACVIRHYDGNADSLYQTMSDSRMLLLFSCSFMSDSLRPHRP